MSKKFKLIDALPDRTTLGSTPDPLLIEFADTLRANPGIWGEYPKRLSEKSRYQAVHQIRSGLGAVAFREGKFEATVRNKVLYVRYIEE